MEEEYKFILNKKHTSLNIHTIKIYTGLSINIFTPTQPSKGTFYICLVILMIEMLFNKIFTTKEGTSSSN
jgi:hypothetical protein